MVNGNDGEGVTTVTETITKRGESAVADLAEIRRVEGHAQDAIESRFGAIEPFADIWVREYHALCARFARNHGFDPRPKM